MKKTLAVTMLALVVLLSMTATASTGRYDQQIQQAVSHKIQETRQLQKVNSSVEDGIVTLTGTVNLYQDKLDAAKKVKKIANVNGVRNDIVVAGETLPDSQLQQKLAKQLAWDRVGYFDNAFNYLSVTVKNGVVTLTGAVTFDSLDNPLSRTAVWGMLQKIKAHRDLTVLITTHYMDEADKLCDRIAIVDHGKLVVLDSPEALKASIPGRDPKTVTLDDVFVHYTGRDLRDALQEPSAADSPFVMRR